MKMHSTKLGLMTVIAAGGALGFTGAAQAASVQSLIVGQYGATPTNNPVTGPLIIDDADFSLVRNPDGTSKTSGDLEVNDILFGTLAISGVDAGTPGGVSMGTSDQKLVGLYALKVKSLNDEDGNGQSVNVGDSVTATAINNADVAALQVGLGLSNLSSYGFGTTNSAGTNAMLALFLDGDDNGQATGSDSLYSTGNPFIFGSVTDGSFWASFGGANGSYTITAESNTVTSADNIADLFQVDEAVASTANPLASINLSVDPVINSTGFLTFNGPLTAGGSGSSTLIGGNSGIDSGKRGVLSDITFSINATAVPTPAAAVPALLLCGGFGLLGRRRRQELA